MDRISDTEYITGHLFNNGQPKSKAELERFVKRIISKELNTEYLRNLIHHELSEMLKDVIKDAGDGS